MIRLEIKKQIFAATQKEFGNVLIPDFSVETPENPEHGDYATNIAMVLARFLKKNPMEIAADIAAEFKIQNSSASPSGAGRVKFKIQVAPPGFINFSLTENALQKEFFEILQKKERYGAGARKKEKIQIEFISANPTGFLTIGNGRGAFLGDALANVLSFSGVNATREYYVNNAKSSTQIKELGKTGMGKSTTYLTPELKKIIQKLKKRIAIVKKKLPKNPIYKKKEQKIEGEAGYLLAQEIQKENKKFIEKTLKIKFNKWFFEEDLYKKAAIGIINQKLHKKRLVYSKDEAFWFRASQFGDNEDRVLIRSNGEPTYILPDLAYHWDKFVGRKFNKVIDVWGADHHGYVPRLRAGLRALGIDDQKLTIIITQLVRLVKDGKEVKMSKRAGNAILFSDLIREVGLDAARFFFLAHSPDTHMDFDMALAKERSLKNPVYYVQYAFVRCGSILQKAKSEKSKVKNTIQNPKVIEILDTAEERALLKKLIQFPEVIEDTAHDYQVHRLTRYATELAGSFHNFYETHRVITEDTATTEARSGLVKATRIVLQNLLVLTGISTPKKM